MHLLWHVCEYCVVVSGVTVGIYNDMYS
jgi:hypothetical protein